MVAETCEDVYNTEKPLMLVGCYKNESHLKWIKEKSLYNIRFGERKGAAKSIISAKRLLLYNANDINEYYVYNLDPVESKIADYDTMLQLEYPNLKQNRQYILYKIKDLVEFHSVYDVKAIKGDKGNVPMFVEY